MKKTYQVPEIEVMLMESTALMEESLGVYDTEITNSQMLSREIIFDDDEE